METRVIKIWHRTALRFLYTVEVLRDGEWCRWLDDNYLFFETSAEAMRIAHGLARGVPYRYEDAIIVASYAPLDDDDDE
jgi:hypothetical protein